MATKASHKIKTFKDLRVWQSARELCLAVYRITSDFPKDEKFGITSQIRRSAVSVPSNLAEGFGRQTAREKHQFYHHSLGSLFELETQLDISFALGYVSKEDFSNVDAELNKCKGMLLALIKTNQAHFVNRSSLISNQGGL